MKNDNVLQFPKDHAVRVRLRDRGTHQKAVLALSILSVLMLSVLSNQYLARPAATQASGGGRSIASVGETVTVADIKWEHELAQQLSQSKGITAHLAERPSLRDELVFGELEGRYGVRVKDGKVEAIEFASSNGSIPLFVKDRAALLRKYRSVFAFNFDDAGLASSKDGEETWNLMSENRDIVGQARIGLDLEGRLTSISLTK